MRSQQKLFYRYSENAPLGSVQWIGLRPARREPLMAVQQVQALADLGLEGDHRASKTPGSARQVSFISQEQISTIAQLTGKGQIDPALLRRNIVIAGVNINILRHQHFRIGEAEFLGTAACHPCSRMNEVLGENGAAAMYGHGGLCAKILKSGLISVGDKIEVLPPSEA